jgi:hypothetical protein
MEETWKKTMNLTMMSLKDSINHQYSIQSKILKTLTMDYFLDIDKDGLMLFNQNIQILGQLLTNLKKIKEIEVYKFYLSSN